MADNTLATDDGSTDDPVAPEETELVVELRHLGIVQAQLDGGARTPVKVGKTDQHRRLGLARLHDLAGLAERARAIRERHQDNPTVARSTDVEAVLFGLRDHFASRFHGWVPVLGKNRAVATVAPLPGGGRHPLSLVDPSPLSAADLPARPAPAGAGVRVAVVDTGAFRHERFVGHTLEGQLRDPAVAREPRPPWRGHATFVADLILQQAPSAELVLKTGLTEPQGRTHSWALACLLADLADLDIDIVNLSLGTQTGDGAPPLVISRAVEVLGPATVIVAAAGNIDLEGGFDQPAPVWPAALPDVLAVGSTDGGFSPDVPWVDLVAPGDNVAAAYPSGAVRLSSGVVEFPGAAIWSGTSFSAATATGRIAALATRGGAGQAVETLRAPGTRDEFVSSFVLAG